VTPVPAFLIALGGTCVLVGLCVSLVQASIKLGSESWLACLIVVTFDTGIMLCALTAIVLIWAVWWNTLGGAK
jgi:hypothetical protein